MEKHAIIVAGGEGTRLGGALPKQFREVAGKPLLWWSMKAFHDEDIATRIILVLHPDFIGMWKNMFCNLSKEERIPHEIVPGGSSRTESVRHGLRLVSDSPDSFVAVHDAARPLATVEMINRGWMTAADCGGAIPVIPVTDSLRFFKDGASKAVDRSVYVAVQTPQVFRSGLLKSAYAGNPDVVYSDDASAFEAAGMVPALFDGSPMNMKVTNPGDLEIAALLIEKSWMNGRGVL